MFSFGVHLDLALDADRYILKRWLEIAPDHPEVACLVEKVRKKQPAELAALLGECSQAFLSAM